MTLDLVNRIKVSIATLKQNIYEENLHCSICQDKKRERKKLKRFIQHFDESKKRDVVLFRSLILNIKKRNMEDTEDRSCSFSGILKRIIELTRNRRKIEGD